MTKKRLFLKSVVQVGSNRVKEAVPFPGVAHCCSGSFLHSFVSQMVCTKSVSQSKGNLFIDPKHVDCTKYTVH